MIRKVNKKLKMVLVSDDFGFLNFLLQVLDIGKFDVSVVGPTDNVVDTLRKTDADIVIISFEELSKSELIDMLLSLKHMNKKMNLILMSEYFDDVFRNKAMDAGVKDFICKRLDEATMAKVLLKIIEKRSRIKKVYKGKTDNEDKERVLVVDDEPSIREVLSRFLKKRGYSVDTARDGIEALEKVQSVKPKVMLLDITMPRMGGIEVMSRLKGMDENIGVIVISGNSDFEDARKMIRMGAYDYITKPLDLEYLETSVWSKVFLMTN